MLASIHKSFVVLSYQKLYLHHKPINQPVIQFTWHTQQRSSNFTNKYIFIQIKTTFFNISYKKKCGFSVKS